jgi:hypothetical protein
VKLKVQILTAAIIVLAVYVSAAQAQANLTFSGGNGTPLTITLQQSVSYTINNAQCVSDGPIFIFDETGNPFSIGTQFVTGTISFSINGGAAQAIIRARSGATVNNISANDIYIYDAQPGAPSGSTVVLSAGTLRTNNNVAGAPPASGSFTTFITNGTGVRCSTNGVATVTTASSVSISGRVLTASGRGLAKAAIYLTDLQGNRRVARTNSFGYYRFSDIAAGQTVTIEVVSKRYQFAPQVVNVMEEIDDLNFAAF